MSAHTTSMENGSKKDASKSSVNIHPGMKSATKQSDVKPVLQHQVSPVMSVSDYHSDTPNYNTDDVDPAMMVNLYNAHNADILESGDVVAPSEGIPGTQQQYV